MFVPREREEWPVLGRKRPDVALPETRMATRFPGGKPSQGERAAKSESGRNVLHRASAKAATLGRKRPFLAFSRPGW